jgi:hypothetical protein
MGANTVKRITNAVGWQSAGDEYWPRANGASQCCTTLYVRIDWQIICHFSDFAIHFGIFFYVI